MFSFFVYLLAIIILNLFFYSIPFVFIGIKMEDLLPYQIWFNVLIILIGLIPRH
jgi:hypothetical protein